MKQKTKNKKQKRTTYLLYVNIILKYNIDILQKNIIYKIEIKQYRYINI